MGMDITRETETTESLSGNETEEAEQTEEEGNNETAGGSRTIELLLGDRTGCPTQQAATARISSEATHILDNVLTKSQDEIVLEGNKTPGETEKHDLLPAEFSDKGLENLRKEVNEENNSKPMPKPTPGGELHPGPTSAIKPPENKEQGKY